MSQSKPPSPNNGLGDLVAAAFASVGITKDRAQAVANAAGVKDCGCRQRQQRLNELGYRVGIGSPAGDVNPDTGVAEKATMH